MTVLRVREPRRHLAFDDAVPDGSRPRPRALIIQQRHRADLAWPMAVLAVLLKNRQDVFRKGHRRCRSVLRSAAGARNADDQTDHADGYQQPSPRTPHTPPSDRMKHGP